MPDDDPNPREHPSDGSAEPNGDKPEDTPEASDAGPDGGSGPGEVQREGGCRASDEGSGDVPAPEGEAPDEPQKREIHIDDARALMLRRKHGITAKGLAIGDPPVLLDVHENLVERLRPGGPVENMLVDKITHTYLRLMRCAKAEAEYTEMTWEVDDGLRTRGMQKVEVGGEVLWERETGFRPEMFERTVRLFGHYDETLTNQLLKLLHELERIQRQRLGDDVPPPLAGDLTVHVQEKQKKEEGQSEKE